LFEPVERQDARFGQVAQQYLQLRLAELTANGAGVKFIEKLTSHVALIVEIVGAQTSVASVDFDLCQTVRGTMAHVPANLSKLYKDKPLEKVIALASEQGKPALRPVPQGGYLRVLTAILELAVRKQLIRSNPAA